MNIINNKSILFILILLTNKITDLENNNKILTNIIDLFIYNQLNFINNV